MFLIPTDLKKEFHDAAEVAEAGRGIEELGEILRLNHGL